MSPSLQNPWSEPSARHRHTAAPLILASLFGVAFLSGAAHADIGNPEDGTPSGPPNVSELLGPLAAVGELSTTPTTPTTQPEKPEPAGDPGEAAHPATGTPDDADPPDLSELLGPLAAVADVPTTPTAQPETVETARAPTGTRADATRPERPSPAEPAARPDQPNYAGSLFAAEGTAVDVVSGIKTLRQQGKPLSGAFTSLPRGYLTELTQSGTTATDLTPTGNPVIDQVVVQGGIGALQTAAMNEAAKAVERQLPRIQQRNREWWADRHLPEVPIRYPRGTAPQLSSSLPTGVLASFNLYMPALNIANRQIQERMGWVSQPTDPDNGPYWKEVLSEAAEGAAGGLPAFLHSLATEPGNALRNARPQKSVPRLLLEEVPGAAVAALQRATVTLAQKRPPHPDTVYDTLLGGAQATLAGVDRVVGDGDTGDSAALRSATAAGNLGAALATGVWDAEAQAYTTPLRIGARNLQDLWDAGSAALAGQEPPVTRPLDDTGIVSADAQRSLARHRKQASDAYHDVLEHTCDTSQDCIVSGVANAADGIGNATRSAWYGLLSLDPNGGSVYRDLDLPVPADRAKQLLSDSGASFRRAWTAAQRGGERLHPLVWGLH